MCGRFACSKIPKILAELLDAPPPAEFEPRRNIAPSMPVCAVLRTAPSNRITCEWLRWGLTPPWARPPAAGGLLFNARAETAAVKPAFRAAFQDRRCLIPADGFYEWRKDGRRRLPYYIDLPEAPMVFAGLWETGRGRAGGALRSCTILTVPANAAVRDLHDRMPAILPPDAWRAWLDPRTADPGRMLQPYPPEGLRVTPLAPPPEPQLKLF